MPDAVKHSHNIIEQAADQSHVSLLVMDYMRLGTGWQTKGPTGRQANGFPNAAGIQGGANSARGLTNVLDIPDHYRGRTPFSGNFRFYFVGGGVIDTNFMTNINTNTNTYPERTVRGKTWSYQDFTFEPNASVNHFLQITDLPNSGALFSDMAIIHESHIVFWEAGENVPPERIELSSKFNGSIRPMTSVLANLTVNTDDPADRFIGVDYAQYTKWENPDNPGDPLPLFSAKALPIEILVEWCNRAMQDLWYTIPVDTPAAEWTALCDYVAANLNTSLKFKCEFGNELWNAASGFVGFKYCKENGEIKFPSLVGQNFEVIANYAMYLVNTIYAPIAATSFSGSSVVVEWVLGGSAVGATSYVTQAWDCATARLEPDWNTAYAPENLYSYMGVGMYFGGGTSGMNGFLDEVFDWDDYAKCVWADKSYFGAAQNGSKECGKNTLPAGIGGSTVGNPATGALATETIFVGVIAERQKNSDGGTENRQTRLLAGINTPDETPWWRINRTNFPTEKVRIQINIESWTETPSDWHTVVEYAQDENPPTLREMCLNAQILGLGGQSGWNGQLHNAKTIRIGGVDGNADYPSDINWTSWCAERGLTLVGYEGGVGGDGTIGGDFDTGSRWKSELNFGKYDQFVYNWQRAFIDYASQEGVGEIAWYKELGARKYPKNASSPSTRGLVEWLPLPKPIALAGGKLRSVLEGTE